MISIYYQNVRGLRTKTAVFYRNMCLSAYDIVCLTETWLNGSIVDSELFDDRYLVWRSDRDYLDRKQNKGGGVLIAVRREIAAESLMKWSSSAEDLWVTITLRNKKEVGHRSYKIHICTVYICDQNLLNSITVQRLNFVKNLTNIILQNPLDKFIILGDFNLPNILWSPSSVGTSFTPSNILGSHQCEVFDELNTYNLLQYNCFSNINDRVLDLVFSNHDISVKCCDFPLVKEDPQHKSIVCEANFVRFNTMKPLPYKKFIYYNGNYDSICTGLDAIDWNSELYNKPFEDAVSFMYSSLCELRNLYIPLKTVIPSTKYPIWYSKPLIKILKEKYKFHRKYKNYHNKSDYDSFLILRDRAKLVEAECYTSYIDNIENNIKTNPRAFWSYVKTKSQSHSYPSVFHNDNITSDRGEVIANMFGDPFQHGFIRGKSTTSNLLLCSEFISHHMSEFSQVDIIYTDYTKCFDRIDHSVLLNKLKLVGIR
ncbi:hypothetical protein O3G_MSEX010311, partial [Manduca sexta]